MIDQGFCFSADKWGFPDTPLRGLYNRPTVYQEVSGLESIEPFLTRLQNLDQDILEEAASELAHWGEAMKLLLIPGWKPDGRPFGRLATLRYNSVVIPSRSG
jgi:hypothetical protein